MSKRNNMEKGSFLTIIVSWLYSAAVHFLVAVVFYLALTLGLYNIGLPPISFWACFGLWTAWLVAIVVPFMVCYNVVANKKYSGQPTEKDLNE